MFFRQWFVAPGVRPTPSIFARGDVEISREKRVLVRPNVGRDVAPRICPSAEQLRFISGQ